MSLNISSANISSIFPGVSVADSKLLTSFLIDVALFLLLSTFFLLFKKRVKHVYESRCYDENNNNSVPGSSTRDTGSYLPSPDGGVLGWIQSAWRHDEQWILEHRGLDAVVYLTTVRYLLYAITPCTLFALVAVFPAYAAGDVGVQGLQAVSLGNITPSSPLLWVTFITCILFSLWCVTVFYTLYYTVTKLRIRFRSLRVVENYTSLVRELPPCLSATRLGNHFDALMPGQVVSVQVALQSRTLPVHYAHRVTAIRNLEHFWALYYNGGCTERPKLHRACPWWKLPGTWCCGSYMVEDAIDYWTRKMDTIDAEINRVQGKLRRGTGVAFVMFKSIRSAQMIWQSVSHSGNFSNGKSASFFPSPWITEAPPAPESVAFEKLGVTGRNRAVRIVIVNFINVILVCLFYVPIALLVGLSAVDDLGNLPVLGALITRFPVTEGLVRGFLPSLGIAIVNVAMLFTLKVLVAHIGFLDHASNHRSILGRFFLFFIFGNLVGVTLGGTLLQVIQVIYIRPGDAITLIAKAIPLQSPFFINYVMILGIVGNAYFLAKPFEVIWRAVKMRFFCASKRSFRELNGPFYFRFEQAVWPLVVFLFTMVYCLISPLILVMGSFYLAFAYVRARYDFVYFYTVLHPSNGFIFPTFYTCCMWSVIIFQFVTMVMLLLYSFYLAPLLLITMAFSIIIFVLVQLQFSALAKYGTLSQAPQQANVIPPADAYIQPFMLPPKMLLESQDPDVQIVPQALTNANNTEWESFTDMSVSGSFNSDNQGDETPRLLVTPSSPFLSDSDSLKKMDPSHDAIAGIRHRDRNLINDNLLTAHSPRRSRSSKAIVENGPLEKQKEEEEPTAAQGMRNRTVTSFFMVNRNAPSSHALPDWGTEGRDRRKRAATRTAHRREGSYFNVVPVMTPEPAPSTTEKNASSASLIDVEMTPVDGNDFDEDDVEEYLTEREQEDV